MTDPAGFNADENLSLIGLGNRSFNNPKVTGPCDFDCFVRLCHFILSSECELPFVIGRLARYLRRWYLVSPFSCSDLAGLCWRLVATQVICITDGASLFTKTNPPRPFALCRVF